MELRYLRYFVAVAETRNFTRAAEKLSISQPPLSQQILRLEREIGTPLFLRLKSGVELTEAGEAFYKEARQILLLTDQALEKTRGIARGINGQATLGFACSSVFHPILFKRLKKFQTLYPSATLLSEESNMSQLMQSLREGTLDAAFVRLPCQTSQEFNLHTITQESMFLVVRDKEAKTPLDRILRELPLILFPRELAPSLYDLIVRFCHDHGVAPQLATQAPQMSASIAMVASGFGFTFVPESLTVITMPGVSYQKIEDPQLTTEIALAWRRWDRSPIIKHLLSLVSADCDEE
ncbi:LysR family transcriptional regulator [Rosenbergiella sp. S61]|uniref:LysR family transcriptional regulator n=1 Tax=Rosenbergiella gaditana TaxID=2726987 RepID=A0ABS5T1G9_9GAMM|nr:LysR family transcriptional regulator [Rosenbergiella gaditana]MBT0725355.1 LysR family transcriptional regulator [Rosenbergiella gaditana]